MEAVITITIHEAGQIYASLSPSGLSRLTPELKRKLRDAPEIARPISLATDETPQKQL